MMEFTDTSQPAKKQYTGKDTITISAGQYLSIRHGPEESPTVDVEEQVPAGKTWSAKIWVEVVET